MERSIRVVVGVVPFLASFHTRSEQAAGVRLLLVFYLTDGGGLCRQDVTLRVGGGVLYIGIFNATGAQDSLSLSFWWHSDLQAQARGPVDLRLVSTMRSQSHGGSQPIDCSSGLPWGSI